MPSYQGLEEHVGAIVAILSVTASLAAFLFWRLFCRVETRLDSIDNKLTKWVEEHVACRERQIREFARREEVDRLKEEILGELKELRRERKANWDEMWLVFNNHVHTADGSVVRRDRK